MSRGPRFGTLTGHLAELRRALLDLERQSEEVERWGIALAEVLGRGGRLLAAGNGGSAAEAQHLTAELVGRFEGERRPLSAIALHADTSSLTAIGNDYGGEEIFARQAEAHGRPGDVLILLSTSGRSANVLCAAQRGSGAGLQVWALTGAAPNPLAAVADRAITVGSASTSAVQEAHLVAVHALCAAVERHLTRLDDHADGRVNGRVNGRANGRANGRLADAAGPARLLGLSGLVRPR